uniref:Major facilitator superfamily (MFS) profile domain-containing protein n=1 Tax=Spongospora subterranea TaxID=70186 RepID=A0A0H5QS19_9EUKA|eukprot:CRZ04351.1 hypothetical protein [Spongospora subterranea]
MIASNETKIVDVDETDGGNNGTSKPHSGVKHPRWKFLLALFFLSTLFQSFKPSTPFLAPFLQIIQEIPSDTLSNHFYPYRTYATNFFMVPTVVLAEFMFGYQPILIMGIVARVSEQFLVYYCSGLGFMQLSQVLHGLASSTKPVHGALLYLLVPNHLFPMTTGFLRTANLSGQVFEGILSNIISHCASHPYFVLFTMTQVSVTLGGCIMLLLFIILAFDRHSMMTKDSNRPLAPKITSVSMGVSLLKQVYIDSPGVLLWSFWWWTAYAVAELVDDMHMNLLGDFGAPKHNGYLSASIGAFSALGALSTGLCKGFVRDYSPLIVLFGLFTIGILLIVINIVRSLTFGYAVIIYCFFMFESCAVAANSIISVTIPKSLRGLTLFANCLLSLTMQSMLQAACTIFDLSCEGKFNMLGCVLLFLGLVIGTANLVCSDPTGSHPEVDDSTVSAKDSTGHRTKLSKPTVSVAVLKRT